MKKLRTIVLVLALLTVQSVSARAAVLETGGEIRVRGWWLDNYVKDGESAEFWDQRLRLTMTWPVAERVRVQVRADILEGMWGEDYPAAAPAAVAPAAGSPPAAPPVLGNPTRQQIAFDWVNLQFVLPGTPLRLTIGRQDVSWGTGFWVQADSRDRFEVAAKLDSVIIVFAYDKFVEVAANHDPLDDQRGWAVGAVTDAAGFRFGLLVAYLKDGSRSRFPTGDVSYVAGDLFAKGALGPAKLQAEFYYGGGTLDRGALGDLDLGGLGGYAGVFLPVGPSVSIGLEGAYARGDDLKTTGRNEGVFSADYQGPYWSVIFYNNLDYSGYGGDSQTSSTGLDFGVRNAVTGKFSAVYAPTKSLSLTGAGLYAAADQTRDGVDAAMGWEFDAVAVYGITENVSFTLGVGYALLGDYWKSAPIAGGSGRKPDNPLGGVAAFTATF
jgi:hypothetical protein